MFITQEETLYRYCPGSRRVIFQKRVTLFVLLLVIFHTGCGPTFFQIA